MAVGKRAVVGDGSLGGRLRYSPPLSKGRVERAMGEAGRVPCFVAAAAVAGWFGGGWRAPLDVPAVGAPVPEFRMADQDGRLITAASLKGKRYLLAFYPKDFTPG